MLGARVTTNVMVRDLDLEAMSVQDGRRLEVYRGRVASPWRGIVGDRHHDCVAANVDGLRLAAARRLKERTYPELQVAVVWLFWPLRSAVAGPRRRWCS